MHDQVELPEADVLVHAGDLTISGTPAECRRALQWVNAQPHQWKVVVAGNHDFAFQDKAELLIADLDVIYLQDSEINIDGVKFWGSPVTPWFCDWAFNVHRGAPIKKVWEKIP